MLRTSKASLSLKVSTPVMDQEANFIPKTATEPPGTGRGIISRVIAGLKKLDEEPWKGHDKFLQLLNWTNGMRRF